MGGWLMQVYYIDIVICYCFSYIALKPFFIIVMPVGEIARRCICFF